MVRFTHVLCGVLILSGAVFGVDAYREKVEQEAQGLAESIAGVDVVNASLPVAEFNGEPIRSQETLPKEEIIENYSTGALVRIQQDIEKLQNEIALTTQELFLANKEIDAYESSIAEKEMSLAEKKALAEYYIRTYYQTRRDASLQLGFLNSKSYKDFLYRYSTTEEIMERLARSVSKDVKDEEELEKNQSLVQMKANLYQSALLELDEKQEELRMKQAELRAFLSSHGLDLAIEQFDAGSKIGNYIARSKYGYTMERTGKFMILPVKGEVTSSYGGRVHPIYGDDRHHAGVDIGVDTGTPIRAAADGVVIMASWYGGYGKVVMINHGNNIVTVYGHNDKILVDNGQVVEQGQVIALAGSTGNSTGPHCHFEVRRNGDDIDPYTYVVAR